MATQTRRTRSTKKVEEVKPPSDTLYEVINGGGIVHMIKQNGITIFDEKSNEVRSIRYCPNEPSIFLDEQSDHAVREPIVFREKVLMVPRTKPNLKTYLDAHPDNVKNGGSIFKEVDKAKSAEDSLESEFNIVEAVALVRDKPIEELIPVAIYFGVNINHSSSEIRFNLLRIAKNKPKEFMESFDSPLVKARSLVYRANEFQFISNRTDGVYWMDSGNLICAVPVGQKHNDVMARFLLSEKGASVMADLEDRLSKL